MGKGVRGWAHRTDTRSTICESLIQRPWHPGNGHARQTHISRAEPGLAGVNGATDVGTALTGEPSS
jgi:hypothetical protein